VLHIVVLISTFANWRESVLILFALVLLLLVIVLFLVLGYYVGFAVPYLPNFLLWRSVASCLASVWVVTFGGIPSYLGIE